MDKKELEGFNEDESLITPEERAMLNDTFTMDPLSDDDMRLRNSQLDNTDFEGDLLNEKSSADDASGNDLDIPGESDEDTNEVPGEEDEENSGYSVSDTD